MESFNNNSHNNDLKEKIESFKNNYSDEFMSEKLETFKRNLESTNLKEQSESLKADLINKSLIVKMQGGLGNQMFIYAFAKSLEQKGYKVAIDSSWYNHTKNTNPQYHYDNITMPPTIRHCEITSYNLTLPLIQDFDTNLFYQQYDRFYLFHKGINKIIPKPLRSPAYKYSIFEGKKLAMKMQEEKPIFPLHAYFSGYFQSLAYISSTTNLLLHDFSLKEPLSSANQALQEQIAHTPDSVFLHIRRGDYLASQYNSRFVQLTDGYYNTCLMQLKQKVQSPTLFVFSNDIAWCKEQFLKSLDSHIIQNLHFEFIANNDESNAIADMELMRSCKHGIIANSTFSWWAAYLLQNSDKVIFAPSKFFHDSTNAQMQELYPAHWNCIQI